MCLEGGGDGFKEYVIGIGWRMVSWCLCSFVHFLQNSSLKCARRQNAFCERTTLRSLTFPKYIFPCAHFKSYNLKKFPKNQPLAILLCNHFSNVFSYSVKGDKIAKPRSYPPRIAAAPRTPLQCLRTRGKERDE